MNVTDTDSMPLKQSATNQISVQHPVRMKVVNSIQNLVE